MSSLGGMVVAVTIHKIGIGVGEAVIVFKARLEYFLSRALGNRLLVIK